jgi:predicted nucleotidyltransferase
MTLGPQAQAALDEVLAREDPSIIGVVLSGSAARTGMATEHSDVDVFVVRTDEGAEGRTTSRSRYIDEVPQTLADLQDVPMWGGAEYGYRWGYCYSRVLRDETGGRIPAALRRMETHTVAEAWRMLLHGDQLDGYVNMPTAPSSPTVTAARSRAGSTPPSPCPGGWTSSSPWRAASGPTTSTSRGSSASTR